MTPRKLEALKQTFPWRRHISAGIPGIVQVFDRNGREVPLFDMLDIIEAVTAQRQPPQPKAPPEQPA